MRKITIIEFMSMKRASFHQSIRQEEIGRMISSITSKSNVSVVDLSTTMHVLSMNITTRAVFGRREASRLDKILTETQAVAVGFFFADYIPVLRWLDRITGIKSRLDKNCEVLDNFYDEIIEEHMDPATVLQDGGEDLLDALLRNQEEGGSNVTTENIKAIIIDMLLGGSDTSSSAVEWGMTELMRNPKVMKKAQDEVRRIVGKKGKVEEFDLPQLDYLKMTVKEILRLHPPGPFLLHRETIRSFKVGEYSIPAKARVIVNAWAIGREENSWEMQEEFYPERFIDNPIDKNARFPTDTIWSRD